MRNTKRRPGKFGPGIIVSGNAFSVSWTLPWNVPPWFGQDRHSATTRVIRPQELLVGTIGPWCCFFVLREKRFLATTGFPVVFKQTQHLSQRTATFFFVVNETNFFGTKVFFFEKYVSFLWKKKTRVLVGNEFKKVDLEALSF